MNQKETGYRKEPCLEPFILEPEAVRSDPAERPVISGEATKVIIEAADLFVKGIEELLAQAFEALHPIFSAIASVQKNMNDAMLYTIATPREWHLYKHSKKRRTREKYRKRLQRRLITLKQAMK